MRRVPLEQIIKSPQRYQHQERFYNVQAVTPGALLQALPVAAQDLVRVHAFLHAGFAEVGGGGSRESGTLIVTPDKVYDLSDEIDDELAEFKTFMSRREYKIINKRLRRGLLRSIQDGCYVANAPYGYKKAVVDRRPTLEIYEPEAEFVRLMYSIYADFPNICRIAEDLRDAVSGKGGGAVRTGPHGVDLAGNCSGSWNPWSQAGTTPYCVWIWTASPGAA